MRLLLNRLFLLRKPLAGPNRWSSRCSSASSSTASFALDPIFADLGLRTHEDLHRFSVEKVCVLPILILYYVGIC